jgi:elongation factor G
VEHDPATRQTVLTGAGETHLAVAISRVERAGVPLDVEPTKVAYRETLAGPVEVEGRYKKQTGGHGQFGVAMVRFEPMPRGTGYEFASEVVGGAIPKQLIPAVGAGIEDGMTRGGRYGFPVVDLRAVCTDGKYHSVDSSEMSFKMAGALALRTALEKVGSILLEPVSEMRVQVPSQYQGDVLGDLSSRRGQVLGTDAADGSVEIHALVPSSEIQKYAVDLRSISGGTGAFEVAHHGYQPLPDMLINQVTTK